MNEFSTMYHYFKGISSTNPSSSKDNQAATVIERKPSEGVSPSSPFKKQQQQTSPTTSQQQQEYMEMSSSSSDHDSNPTINAVTNLNYINVETSAKDEEMQKNVNESIKSTDECDGGGIIMSNELRILEPAYYDSNATAGSFMKTDAFSQQCSMALEDCSGTATASSSLNGSTNSESDPNSQLASDYMIQPSNRPVTQCHPSVQEFGDYLIQPSNKPVIADISNKLQPQQNQFVFPGGCPSSHPSSSTNPSHLKLQFKKKDQSKKGTLRRQGSDTSKTSVDDELVEIMNDFKNNVFTIQEVEQLVVSWKTRNDVQQSFKEKEAQLQLMRTQYDSLQEQMKEKMKRPTPFERVKKLFSRSKPLTDEPIDPKSPTTTAGGHRPISSLSLQSICSSSSSSGRMSTGSVCSGTSLGDSGTHSDHDERRFTGGSSNASTCRIGTPGSLLLDNYVVPPTPRPVSSSSASTTPTSPNRQPFSFPSSAMMKSPPITEHSEHYVMFPSNVPVFAAQSPPPTNDHHDYINFSGLNTIDETKETSDGNGVVENSATTVTVQPIKVQKPDPIYGPAKRSVPCSSFKPSTSVAIVAAATTKEDGKVFFNNAATSNGQQNASAITNKTFNTMAELDAKTMESLKNLTKSIDGCNASLSIAHQLKKSNSARDCSHEYMNV